MIMYQPNHPSRKLMAYNDMPTTTTIHDWNELCLTWVVGRGVKEEKERERGVGWVERKWGGGERKLRWERAKLRY